MSAVLALADGAAGLPDPQGASHARVRGWRQLLDALADATWIVRGRDRRVVACNVAACRLLALPDAELLGRSAERLIPGPEDAAFWDEVRRAEPGATAPSLSSETRLRSADGRELFVMRSIRPLPADDRQWQRHYLVSVSDRSAWRAAEDQREQVLGELQATLESTADGILVTDLEGRIRAFNQRFAQLWQVPAELLERRDDKAVHAWMRRHVDDTGAYQQRLQDIQAATLLDDTERISLRSGVVLERVTRPLWCRGQAMGRVYSFRDLSDGLAAQQRIEQLSSTDALTGLPNRRHLYEQTALACQRVQREGGGFALLLIDLDRFRQINLSLGLDSGDGVLVEVAQRVRECVRAHDLLARTGGDQFAVLMHRADAMAAERAARRVLDAVAAPYVLAGSPFTLTCSIGGALCPQHGRSADDLVRHAEAAVAAVKRAGRANYRVQQARPATDRGADMQLEHAMRQTLAASRFRLAYQPQIDLQSGEVIGAEALLRWRDARLGEISPARFIPVAEDSGLIVALGDWVLVQAVRQGAAWLAAGLDVPIAINVSALQFEQPRFVERVAEVLAASGLPPQRLELELTESILVRDAAEALQRLQALARIGVRLAIDDFGTGYSSLAYLKRFPIDKLKIDRSFILGLPGDGSDAAIVVAVLQMARALDMKVVAEGVETPAQRQFLLERGCDHYQGFLFAPALDSASFEQRLRAMAAKRVPIGAEPLRLNHTQPTELSA